MYTPIRRSKEAFSFFTSRLARPVPARAVRTFLLRWSLRRLSRTCNRYRASRARSVLGELRLRRSMLALSMDACRASAVVRRSERDAAGRAGDRAVSRAWHLLKLDAEVGHYMYLSNYLSICLSSCLSIYLLYTIRIYICTLYMYVYIYMCVYAYIYIYIHTYIGCGAAC